MARPVKEEAIMAADQTVATLKKGDHNPFVHALLEQASELNDELRGKGGLYERVGANRETLRQIATTGLLSKDQAKAIKEFYPERTVKPKATEASAPAEPAKS